MAGKHKRYTPECREQSVRLVLGTGRPFGHVAKEIDVGEQMLGNWVAQVKARMQGGDGRTLDADERAELEPLRNENAELRLDRDFVKKAAAFFARSSTGIRLPVDRGGESRRQHRPHGQTA